MSKQALITFNSAPFNIIDGDRGKNYPKQNEFSDAGYCLFLSATNVTREGFDFSQCQFISEQKNNVLRKGKLQRDDVVLTTRGTIGNTAFLNSSVPYEHMRINSGMVILRCDQDEILPAYLYHFLRSPQFHGQVNSLRSGVAQPQLPIRDMRRIKMPLPKLSVQQSISDILSAYDDLIENNRRRIQLLEQAAQLLYKEWFVHLRFPGHEHVNIADGVPEGWKQSTVSNLGEIVTGKTPSTKTPENFGYNIPFVKTPDMHRSRVIVKTEEFLSERGANTQANKTLPVGSILVACIGARLGVVSITCKPCQTNQQINAVIPCQDRYRYYSLFTLIDIKPRLEAMGGGATMPNVNKSKFASITILIPSQILLQEFQEFAHYTFKQIQLLHQQNIALIKARDLLLPRLMNGAVTV